MGSTLRLILRLFIVPLAILVAVMAAALVAGIANWTRFSAQAADLNDAPAFLLAAFFVVAVRSAAVALMLLPGLIGVVVSEALAIRNILAHTLNGALSIWIGWTTMAADQNLLVFDDPKTVIAAGTAADSPIGWWRAGAPGSGSPSLETK